MICCDSISVRFADSGPAVRPDVQPSFALNDVNVSFAVDSITALVGPSGCGKTTLLRVLAGLQIPTTGRVVFDPMPAMDSGELAFVFQRPALLPWLTASENVRLPLDLLRQGDMPRRCQDALEMLDRVELGGEAAKYPHQLSGGMQMRVSIARAMVTRPKVLLLDEPLSALDEVLRDQLGDLFLKLWKDISFTAVMVTHNIAEAVKLSHRIVVMKHGQVKETIDNDLPWPRTLCPTTPSRPSPSQPTQVSRTVDSQPHGLESDPRFGQLYSRVGMSLRCEESR